MFISPKQIIQNHSLQFKFIFMGGKARKNQEWGITEVASEYVKKEAWKVVEKIKVNGNQPDGGMLHSYGQKKKATKKAVDKARNDMEADVYTKLDEDAVKKMT